MNLENLILDFTKIKAELCKREFYEFTLDFVDIVFTDEFIPNWHIKYMCDELQKLAYYIINNLPKPYDLLINICPGTTKSTLISILFPCWLWTNKPDACILLMTISDTNGKKFGLKRRDILLSDKYRSYYPEISIRNDANGVYFIGNTLGGEMWQYSTRGTKTGNHGHVKIIDDLMSHKDSISESKAKDCIEGLIELGSRNKDISKTPFIQVEQRLSPIDGTNHVLRTTKKDKLKHIVLPAKVNEYIKPSELEKNYIDGYLDPIRLGEEALEDAKRRLLSGEDDEEEEGGEITPMSEAAFNAQYLQDVTSKEGLLYDKLQFEDFSKIDFNGYYTSYSATDPADDGDDTWGSIGVTQIGKKFYVREVVYNSFDSNYNIPFFEKKITKVLNCLKNIIETNGLGSVVAKRIKNETKTFGIVPLNNGDDKIDRINSYSFIIQEYFVFDSSNENPEYKRFIRHLKTLPKQGDKKKVGAADVCTHLAKWLYLSKKIIK